MTNKEAHELAAGMGLDNMFFRINGIDPDVMAKYAGCENCLHYNDKDHDEKGSACALCFDGSNYEDVNDMTNRCENCVHMYDYEGKCGCEPVY
jgi:hypothetical protein